MDSLGYTFFQGFTDLVTLLRWPLIAVFVLFIGRQVWRFKPEERLQSLLMFVYFFVVICVFWILKPLKKGMFLEYYSVGGLDLFGWQLTGPQAEMLAKVLNMFVALVAMIVFSALSRTFRRQQLSYITAAFFAVCFVVYSLLLNNPGDWTVWSFYMYGDLWTTVMVVTFFAFLNDSVDSDAAKRLYGLIVLGGVTGGVFGSSMVASKVSAEGPASWMWLCFALTGLIAIVALLAGRGVAVAESTAPPTREERSAGEENPALAGAKLVFRSPYLLAIVAIVGLYEMVSTIMDFQLSATIDFFVPKDEIRGQVSRVFSFTTWVALGVQIFLTSLVMTRWGLGVALLFLPLAALAGSVGFLVFPVLLLGCLLNTADNGFSYSINQSAKEVLYVPTTREEKYKGKAFIDMFVQRFAKALAVVLTLIMTTVISGFGGVRWLSILTGAILVLWILAVRYAGRAFAETEVAAAEPTR